MEDDDKEKEQCSYPRVETNFSSIEELTLSQEQGLIKLVKRLTNNFQLPSFSEEELEDSIPKIREALIYYADNKWETVPDLYFKMPSQHPLVCVSSPVSLSNGEVRDITFKSHFQSSNPMYTERLNSFPRARSVRAKHWRHLDREPLGCVLALHGWMLGDEKASAMTLVPGFFYRMGLDVIVVELPLHGSRSPDHLNPLNMFPSVDPTVTNEGFAQSICELREISHWVKTELDCPIVGLGLSLGAQALSLWASLDELDAAICVAPLLSLSQFIWGQVSGTALESTLVKAKLGADLLERGFAVSNPKSYFLETKKNSVMIIAGRNDVVVPSSHAEALWKHWGEPKIHWVEDGHIEQLITPGTGNEVLSFLHGLGLANKELEPVSRKK